jgi:hypothetical protein
MLVKVEVNFLLLNLGLSLCNVLGSLLKVLCVYRKHKGGHTPDVIRQRGAIFHFSKENKSCKIANNTCDLWFASLPPQAKDENVLIT